MFFSSEGIPGLPREGVFPGLPPPWDCGRQAPAVFSLCRPTTGQEGGPEAALNANARSHPHLDLTQILDVALMGLSGNRLEVDGMIRVGSAGQSGL